MERPAEKAKMWYEYRPIFLTERRIREGTEFWLAHRQDLDEASLSSGVAPEYLAAILGVETYYGRLTGSYRVIDALATLAFDYPARSKFFREELEQFMLLTRDLKLDPLHGQGILRGRDGSAAVHAVELPSLRRRRECGWAHRPVDELVGCMRERGQLPEGAWVECRRAGIERSQRRMPDKTADLDGHQARPRRDGRLIEGEGR